MVRIEVEIPDEVADRLYALVDDDRGLDDIDAVVVRLIDHAQQGVYRPGAWERGWLMQAFGDEWISRLVPDTRPQSLAGDGRVIFDRTRKYGE